MTIQQLKYLIEVSKSGSVNKAAKNLFVTQPTISKAIKELEHDLSITIFNRENTKKLQLTQDGTKLLWFAKELLEQVDTIEETFADKNKAKHVRLMVSSQHYAFVVKAFIEFINRNKKHNFQFLLREKKTYHVIEDVYTQQSELGIIFLSDSTEYFFQKYLNSKNMEFHSLVQVPFHAFIRKGHPLSKQESVTLNDLSKYPYISYEQDNNSLKFLEEAVVIDAKQSIVVLDRATMNNVICNTNSYNIGSGFLIKGIIENDLHSVPISGFNDKMDIGWIKLKSTALSKEAQDFINLCTKYVLPN